MASVDPNDFLVELRHILKQDDMIKGQLLMASFGLLDAKAQNQVLGELARSDTDTAISLLAHLAVSPRTFAVPPLVIRSMLLKNSLENPDHLLRLLDNQSYRNKRILIEIIGEMEYGQAVPSLLKILDSSQEKELLAAVLGALGAIGSHETINTISEYLYSGSRELVVAAIKALSNIETEYSVKSLVERMGTDSDLDLLIIDGFARLQNQPALNELSLALNSSHAHIRNRARSNLIRIGAKAIPTLTENLTSSDNDLLILTLNVLAFIGDDSAVRAIRQLIHDEPQDANVRFAAYEALGMLPLKSGSYLLADGLTDREDHVRIATAKAIERNCTDILIAGVQNMVQQGGQEAEQVVAAFLNAEAYKVIMRIAEIDEFQKLAVDFLVNRAHPDLRCRFAGLFRENGYNDLARSVIPEKEKKTEKPLAYAVDDSRMILSIYKNILFEIGVDSRLFEFPASALEQLKKEKPDLIFTDLNMPDITGLELAENIRALYSKEDLPIIMVTTQGENADHDEAIKIGVNQILHKPFTAEELQAAMDEILQKF